MKKLLNKKKVLFNITPTRVIVSSFAILILTGTLLLNLSISSSDGKSVGLLNALFTSTSASCVTGLVVVDTGTRWSIFGQLVVLFLIQVGGLGIVTLTTFFFTIFGRKIGLKGKILAQESLNDFNFIDILKLVKKVILVTVSIEAIGAVLLSTSFIPQYGLGRGIYMGIFHSISAFCNAGFDIIGNYQSVTHYNGDPVVIYTIAFLIILGGLGFVVWNDIYEYKKNKSLLFHTKVVIVATITLLSVGTILFLMFEYNNPYTLGVLPLNQKFNAAFFHSAVTRTAGYNSVPLGEMKEISKVITILLMFIGAAPGSTAGGIKITTFTVIIVTIISQIKGLNSTLIYKKRLPVFIILKSLSIVGLSVILVLTFTTLILAVENAHFIDILYEVTSAFGTVGLSAVGTPGLTVFSKVLLIITMFLGRVGPVTFAIALILKNKSKKNLIVYPEGKLIVG